MMTRLYAFPLLELAGAILAQVDNQKVGIR